MTTLPTPHRGAAPAVRATWLTCALDGRDHAVVDHDPESGAHLSACAKTVWASSLASPPAARCTDCDDSMGGSRRRRPGRLERWLGRRAG